MIVLSGPKIFQMDDPYCSQTSLYSCEVNKVCSGTNPGRPAAMSSATEGKMASLQVSKIGDLRSRLKGQVLLPEDDGYENARKIWNAMIDKRPGAIVRCLATSDVVNAVNCARESGVALAIRGGGHNIAGKALCDGGIVIDLSQMKAANVDPASRRVTIEAGALLADLDAATQAHGLATPL